MECLRCGREFTNPTPEVLRPGGNLEIASKDWCSACNKLAMAVVFRWSSAYVMNPSDIKDPMKGG